MNSSKQAAFDALVETVLKKIATNEGIKNADVGPEDGALRGEGYVGIVNSVIIKGSNKNLNLIVKTASKDKIVRAKVPLRECFLTELYFYGELIPELKKFHPNVKKFALLNSIPKCYWVETGDYEEILVLENLLPLGYEIYDRTKSLDECHVKIVLKEYAKIHAVSLAAKIACPTKFDDVAEKLGYNARNWFLAGMLGTIHKLCLRAFDSLEEESVKVVFGNFCDTIKPFMLSYDYKKDPYAVVSHADCWSNNMLFQYKNDNGKKQLTDVKLIDFQLSRLASLTYDVSQFLCTCAGEEIWKNIDDYLALYYKTLSSSFAQIADLKLLLTFEKFMDEFRKNARFGLLMSSFFIRVMLIEKEEAPNEEDTVAGTFWSKFTATMKNERAYDDRFKYLIHYFYKSNML